MILAKLLGRLGRARLPPTGLPSVSETQNRLSRAGWTLAPYHVPGLDLVLWRGEYRAVLGIAYLGITEVLLQKAQETALVENAEAVIVVVDDPAAHVIESAETRSVLIAHYSDLDSLSEHLSALRRKRRDRYGAAKHRLLEDEDRQQALTEPETGNLDECTLYRSQYLQADLFDNSGTELVITFGDCDDAPGPTGLINRLAARQQGLSELCIRTFGPNFFPAHDVARLVAELPSSRLTRYETSWAWGIMQGGYGALKYAKTLGCDRALVVSPLLSIDPWDVADPRFNQHFEQSLHFDMSLKAAAMPGLTVALYDPYNDHDAEQVKRIADFKGMSVFQLPFAADATRWLFKAPPFMDELFAAYRSSDTGMISRLAAAARHRLPNREFKMAYALATRRSASSLNIFRKYGQDKIRDWSSVCFLLAKAGHAEEVLPLLEQEAERLPHDVDVNICAAVIALELALPQKALKYVKVGLQADGMNVTYNWIKQTAEKMIR